MRMIPLAPEQIAYLRQLGMTTPMSPTEMVDQYRAAWRSLHSEPLGTPEWFAAWQKMIPTGCGCRQGANDLLTLCPPRYDSPEDWFAWTVEYHNMVNAKLIKPAMPLGQARALWRSRAVETTRHRFGRGRDVTESAAASSRGPRPMSAILARFRSASHCLRQHARGN
jgi:hypothetical protein